MNNIALNRVRFCKKNTCKLTNIFFIDGVYLSMIYILYEHTCNQLFFKDSIYRLFLARIFLKILSRFFLDFFFFVSFNNCFGSIFCHKQMGKKRYGFGCSKNFVFVINITFREVGFSSFGVCRFW